MLLLTYIFISIGLVTAQNQRVTGIVVSEEDGQPIIGASVSVKGASVGAISDIDGKFSISNVPSSAKTLVISYIGMVTQEVAIKQNVKIVLKSNAQVTDEVVVVAYGTAKKSSFTGSAQVIKNDQIEKRVVANVSKALDGVVAGVQSTAGSGQPGSGASVVIRGFGSINASNNPLYVVDGIPFDGNISSINPNDIESMTVLKDASAGALYGARGANGVVMITTKRGKNEGDKIDVNLKANWGVTSRSLKRYNTVNEKEYLELAFEAYKNELINTNGVAPSVAGTQALAKMAGGEGILGVNEEYNPYDSPIAQLIDPSTGKLNSSAKLKYHENWMDELQADSPLRQEYQLSFTGGSKKTKYLASIGYLDEGGLLKTTSFERYSGRLNVDSEAKDWLKSGLSSSFAQYKSNYAAGAGTTQNSNVWYSAQFMAPIYPVYMHSADGGLALNSDGNKQFDYGSNRVNQSNWNPIATLYDDKAETLVDNMSARTYITLHADDDKYGFLKGFNFTTNFGLDYYSARGAEYANPYNGNAVGVSGRLTKESSRMLSYTFNQLLTYNRTFNDHSFDILIGHEYYALKTNFLSAEKTGFPFGGLYELAAASTLTDGTSYEDNYSIDSYLSRLNYNYKEKYYLSGSFRTDGSSRFYKDQRWGTFWSVGASWRISRESFLSDVNWVNNLTLKASYGIQGNDALSSYYPYQSLYSLSYANASASGALISSLENKKLKWEKNANLNVGVEATLFDRLYLTFEYFNKNTKDLLMKMPKATSTGFDSYWNNIGKVRNTGVELSVKVDVLKNTPLKWSFTAMGSHVKNKIIKLADKPEIISGNIILKEGEAINSFYLPTSAGVDPLTGNQLYLIKEKDADGNVTKEYKSSNYSLALSNREIAGNRIPDLYGSFNNEFKYKGFDLSLLTTYSIGGKIYDSNYNVLMGKGILYKGTTFHKNLLRRWQNPGDITDVPKLAWDNNINVTNKDMLDASYFSIKNITVGYTLPKSLLKKIGFESIRIFGTADNLAVFSHLDGMDPQYSLSGTTNYVYTPSKAISIGIDVKF